MKIPLVLMLFIISIGCSTQVDRVNPISVGESFFEGLQAGDTVHIRKLMTDSAQVFEWASRPFGGSPVNVFEQLKNGRIALVKIDTLSRFLVDGIGRDLDIIHIYFTVDTSYFDFRLRYTRDISRQIVISQAILY